MIWKHDEISDAKRWEHIGWKGTTTAIWWLEFAAGKLMLGDQWTAAQETALQNLDAQISAAFWYDRNEDKILAPRSAPGGWPVASRSITRR